MPHLQQEHGKETRAVLWTSWLRVTRQSTVFRTQPWCRAAQKSRELLPLGLGLGAADREAWRDSCE